MLLVPLQRSELHLRQRATRYRISGRLRIAVAAFGLLQSIIERSGKTAAESFVQRKNKPFDQSEIAVDEFAVSGRAAKNFDIIGSRTGQISNVAKVAGQCNGDII